MTKEFDIVVVGAGPGGYVAAIRAAQLDASVALVEEKELGGTCLNWGCIPTKAILESARLFKHMASAEDFGVQVGEYQLNFPRVIARSSQIVSRLRGGIAQLLKKNNVSVIRGRGKLTGNHEVEVQTPDGRETLTARKVIVATGSEALKPGSFPFDGKRVLTTKELLASDHLPESLLVVGGGINGCEFACIFREFGVEVTVVEMLDRLLATLDEDLSREIFRTFKRKRIGVHLGTRVESLETRQNGVVAKLSSGKTVEAEVVLVAVGRKLNSDGIGLEELGVESDRGRVKVDEHLRTTVPDVYAIGDVTGMMLLAHTASRQGIVAAEHACGKDASIDYLAIPACIFTDPEISTVGLSESEAREKGYQVKVGRFPFRGLGKAHVVGETGGFVKIVGEEEGGRILGAHIIGPHASDLIAEAAVAMKAGLTVSQLAQTVHAHPTLAEAVMEAAEDFLGQSIHLA